MNEIQTVSTLIVRVTVHGVQPQVDPIEGDKRINHNFTHDTPTNNNTQEDNQNFLSESMDIYPNTSPPEIIYQVSVGANRW